MGVCGHGCVGVWVYVGGNKSNVLATLMNTVEHMTVTCSMWEVANCHVTITEALNQELHKQRHSLTIGTPLVTAR